MPENPNIRDSTRRDRVQATETFDLIGVSRKPNITLDDARQAAEEVGGSVDAAQYFLHHPNRLLRGRTPQEAVEQGDGQAVIGLLLNVAGL
jgi:hypothetical protein